MAIPRWLPLMALPLVRASLVDCADEGPWTCSVEGCPHPQMGCEQLASYGFCSSAFDDVWSPPPNGTSRVLIHTRCPRACGRCAVAAPPHCNMESLDATLLSPEALGEALSRADAPLIIQGATSKWSTFSYLSLLDDYGDVRVKVVLEGGTRRGETMRQSELYLSEFSSAMFNGSLPSTSYIFFDLGGTQIPQAMPQLGDLLVRAMPAAVGGRLLLSAGSWGNGRPFHGHGPALFALLSGLKQWYIRKANASFSWQTFEVMRSDLRTAEQLASGWEDHMWVCVQSPGELLYVPDQLHHATLNYGAETWGVTFVVDELAPITPLHEAAQADSAGSIRALLLNGASVDAVASNGGTPLHYAAGLGHASAAKALLAGGASVHARAKDGLRPLHLAAAGGHSEAVKVLVEHGAPLEARDEYGHTALDLAVKLGQDGVAQLLRSCSAEFTTSSHTD